MTNNDLIDLFVDILIVGWRIYSAVVIIYLNTLSQKYLTAVAKDDIVGDKTLKDYNDLLKQYEDREAVNILVLSGGGVRGLVPLHVLTYIESITGKKIGELFDFCAGSSTGAISAGGFTVGDGNGGYKFSAKDILEDYENNSKLIFSSPWYHQIFTLFGLFAPRFLPNGKMKVLKGYFNHLTLGELKGNWLIPVYNVDTNNLQIIKSWSSLHGASHENYLVRDLVNGASSPPMLFPPMAFSLKGKSHMFIDPAVLLNNPILHVLLYVRGLFPNKKLNLVLIGNGGTASVKYDYKNMFSFGLYGIYQYLFSAPALSSRLYVEFIEEYLLGAQKFEHGVNFFRVNSMPEKDMSPTDVSKKNMHQIRIFADKMLQENTETIEKIILALSKSTTLKI